MHTKGNAIHNPRDIIDEEPIHNVPMIMDQSRASIIQGELWMSVGHKDYGSQAMTMGAIHNPRVIIDNGCMYNYTTIMSVN